MRDPRGRTARYEREVRILTARDPIIANVIERVGPCTLAPSKDHFLTLVEAVVWQQVSWKAARAIHARLLDTLGTRHPRPAHVASASPRTLAAAGLSRQKARYVKEIARYFADGRFPARRIRRYTDDEVIGALTEITGVGRWTAEMYLIFGLNRLDVFPAGDLGLKKAIGRCYGFDGLREDVRLTAVTDRWRPYRTIGAWYLWSSADGVPLADLPRGRAKGGA
jgi:DNA-3-methyladenine glycosylase II